MSLTYNKISVRTKKVLNCYLKTSTKNFVDNESLAVNWKKYAVKVFMPWPQKFASFNGHSAYQGGGEDSSPRSLKEVFMSSPLKFASFSSHSAGPEGKFKFKVQSLREEQKHIKSRFKYWPKRSLTSLLAVLKPVGFLI